MANLEKYGEYSHRDYLLAQASRKLGNDFFFAMSPFGGSTPTIDSVTLATDAWTALATGLTSLVSWRISEVDGNDFYYAYVAAPGDDFSVAFGWVAQISSPTAIYVKRKTGTTPTLKIETWT